MDVDQDDVDLVDRRQAKPIRIASQWTVYRRERAEGQARCHKYELMKWKVCGPDDEPAADRLRSGW